MSLKYKLGNYRTKLRNAGCMEVMVNSIKQKPKGKSSPADNIKKPHKAEVNYCPSYPSGEIPESLERVRVALLSEATDVAAAEQGIDETVLGISVTKVEGAEAMDLPADTGVVLEAAVVLKDLGCVSLAFAMLLGLIYALNLRYPLKFRYTFEVIQKLFLELDANKLSHKAQALKTKLFSEL
ncbi:hypothetical protein SRHO_G00216020 [Serrasalmus rhombeus]